MKRLGSSRIPPPYEPGAFFRRELPRLLGVLESGPDPDIVVVDGYVELVDGEPGLGAHLHKAITRPVIGVAKTRFSGAAAVEIRRGDSQKPHYVTAAIQVIRSELSHFVNTLKNRKRVAGASVEATEAFKSARQ